MQKGYVMQNNKIHSDDIALAHFCEKMSDKLKLSRESGRGGWDNPKHITNAELSDLLRRLVDKGDPVDVANVAMMISMRGESIETPGG